MRKNIINLTLNDADELYKAYMPYIQNGGLFVATDKGYQMGDEVFILLSLMDEADRLPIPGKVVWITPQHAHNQKPNGIGIQFNPSDNGQIRARIETYLAGKLNSERPTHTF
jgi:type IV pilus assembly protein PilZ